MVVSPKFIVVSVSHLKIITAAGVNHIQLKAKHLLAAA